MAAPDEFSDPRKNLAEELRVRGDSIDSGDSSSGEDGCCPPLPPFIPAEGTGTFLGDTNGDGNVHEIPACTGAYVKSIDLGFLLHSGSDINISFGAHASQDDSGTTKRLKVWVLACGEDPAVLSSLVFAASSGTGDGNPILFADFVTMSGDTTGGNDGNSVHLDFQGYTLGRDTSALSLAIVPEDCDEPWFTDGESFITINSYTDAAPDETDPLTPEYGQWVAPEESEGDDTDTRITNYPYILGSLIVYANGIWIHPDETDPDAGEFTLPFAYDDTVTLDWIYQVADAEILNDNIQATSIDFWSMYSGGGGGGFSGVAEDLTTAEMDTDLVLHPDGAGGVEWGVDATGGGGGGGSVAFTPADEEPGSPGADDDEFSDSTTISDWTTFGTLGAGADIDTTVPHHLWMGVSANDNNLHGKYKACPSIPFTMIAKMSDASLRAADQEAAVFIAEAGLTGKIQFFGMWHNGTAGRIDIQTWNSRTSFAAQPASVAGINTPVYLKVVVNSSSNVDYYYSPMGLVWRTLGLAVNPGFTVAEVGFLLTNQNGTHLIQAAFDWVRFT